MSSSIVGTRELPSSQYDLSTYWGRVRHSMDIVDPRTLLTSQKALDAHTALLEKYKRGEISPQMTPELWHAKKVVDATLHPDTGMPVFLPFRMSCFVFSNLIVTAGMLTPNLTTRGVLCWQIANQTLNVLINTSNANKSSPLSNGQLATSFFLAVGASCGVAVGLGRVVQKVSFKPNAKMILGRLVPFAAVATAGVMNVCLMRGGEIKKGIDVYPTSDDGEKKESLGKSQRAAMFAVGETAVSRVLNATPIMVIPPLLLVRLTATEWLKSRPKLVMPINCGLIFVTSIFALPLALGAFPQRQAVKADSLEPYFWGKGGKEDLVEFNRGI
ncbi:Tricarboxylate/iron carrier [Tuber borchii]|uniref:Sidoreflexin n=1 Tax=Tuber borchii TaxID=42251 RepID=A0A2T6ZQT3_TUBBO|nr:Tricarboxylate/iron carrier [Tuber borchii]